MQPLSYHPANEVIPEAMKTPHNVLAVGIDIAKEKHVAVPLRGTGEKLDTPLRFSSQKSSLDACAQWIETLAQRHACTHLLVGMEPTNMYWTPVYTHLVTRLPQSAVYIVSAITVHWARRMHGSNFSKTDPRDAFIIADLVLNGKCNRPLRHTPTTRQLRTILHDYIRTDAEATIAKSRLTDMLYVCFPEALPTAKGRAIEGRLQILHDTPTPADISAIPREKWIAERIRSGRARKMLHELYQTACDSCTAPPDAPYWQDQWSILYTAWRQRCEQREKLYEIIRTLLHDIPHAAHLFTIPGVGELTAAAFFAGVGDVTQYQCAAQVEKVFGFDFHHWQSGTMNATPHITKRGYSPARRNFYLAACSAAHQPPFNVWYQRQRTLNNHKRGKKILIALAAKLVRICFHIARTGTPFDPTLAVEHE